MFNKTMNFQCLLLYRIHFKQGEQPSESYKENGKAVSIQQIFKPNVLKLVRFFVYYYFQPEQDVNRKLDFLFYQYKYSDTCVRQVKQFSQSCSPDLVPIKVIFVFVFLEIKQLLLITLGLIQQVSFICTISSYQELYLIYRV